MVVCAAGGSLLAGSGITGKGDDFTWETGAKKNEDDWDMAAKTRYQPIDFYDDQDADDEW